MKKGKLLNGFEEIDPLEPFYESRELLTKLDNLFLKEWKIEKIGNSKVNRRTPIYYSGNEFDEMFDSLYKSRQSGDPELTIEILKGILKGEINDILDALEK